MIVRVVITGRGYDAAEAMPRQLELPEGSSVDEALKRVAAASNGRPLAQSCLIAVSGEHLGTLQEHRPRTLADGDELVIIAPVAGG